MSLSELVEDDVGRRVWVEHIACDNSLGIHLTKRDRDGKILIARLPGGSSPGARPRMGRMTTPGVNLLPGRGYRYVEIKCACHPDGHEQKMRMERLGRLEVIFAGDWRWGRRIEPLPVVRI